MHMNVNVRKQNMYIIYLHVIMIDYIKMNSYQTNLGDASPMLEKKDPSPNHHH